MHQGCILSLCLYAEYIMRNAWLDEGQTGIKIARRNINNLRYADDITNSRKKKDLKSLLMRVKEESEKADLKLRIQKTKITASHHLTANRWRTSEILLFSWAPKSLQMVTAATKLKDACSLKGKLWQT